MLDIQLLRKDLPAVVAGLKRRGFDFDEAGFRALEDERKQVQSRTEEAQGKLKTLSKEQQRRAVKVSASILTSDPWQEACQILPDVNTLTRNAAKQAYEQAGVGPDDLDLVELHDCFATAELVHYDNLMLCEEGGAVDLFESGATWRDGKTPVNVSGGLQSKGHPISATGIANIWEVCHHLRGEAGDRQIEGAKVGLAHVIGLGSACGVHVLEKSAA